MEAQPEAYRQYIHLLYVPTLFCNLSCRYCYLGEQTRAGQQAAADPLQTLTYAIDKFKEQGVLPFHISLHGGEVTTLPPAQLDRLFAWITAYYREHKEVLAARGFLKAEPHVKTNLYNFSAVADLFASHHVSVSASIDLPLTLHARYRVDKTGRSSLPQIMDNLALLAKYPYRKKFSSTIYYEHFRRLNELVRDIWHIHRDIGFDMNHFNFMFGFGTKGNDESFLTQTLSGEQQVIFYEAMKREFLGTELEKGLQTSWFEEFTPAFCTNSLNCGEKFFLLQNNGDVYSCVRGQGAKEFYFGNIFSDTVEDILANGWRKVKTVHNNAGLHADCRKCPYLYICKTGCPFVKHAQGAAKSYTCALQRRIYEDYPRLYPGIDEEKEREEVLLGYLEENHPQQRFVYPVAADQEIVLPNDLYEQKNTLRGLIDNDRTLRELYSPEAVSITVDGQSYPLESQILKKTRRILLLNHQHRIALHIQKALLKENCPELVRNTLYLMLLRDTKVVYGDEKREKQEHIFTQQIFYNVLAESVQQTENSFVIDLTGLFCYYQDVFRDGVLNNLFVTTGYLRDYHYQKQKENAFYHIQAINLPFPNIEFYWAKPG